MTRLLDTNVVSEFQKSRPDPKVIAWLGELDFDSAYMSVVTVSEVRFGIERMPRGVRRFALEEWLTTVLPYHFEDRLLPISDVIADRCGVIRAQALDAGRPMSAIDAFLAATTDVHGLTLVTRNVRDFEVWGGPVFNPWTD